uniref:Aldose 1-epimerase n=1 Tax=Plectus sambesii TaxID=2011161 RepID=A0A914X731_9BILA
MTISIEKSVFGTSKNGKEVVLLSLSNENGTLIEILSYGATIRKWIVKDGNGQMRDIVLGYDTFTDYENDKFFLGCVVGRVGNRINGGKFKLDGKEHQLSVNRPPHHLHGGGANALCRKVWDWELVENGVKFSCVSPNGEEGYPGELHIAVTYTLNDQDELTIDYQAKTDAPTIVNLTNHSYFNLENEGSENFKDHVFQFFTDKYLPADDDHLVTGEVCDVRGTRWDFTQAKRIGDICESNFAFDNQMCFDTSTFTGSEMKKLARITSPKSGISLTIASNQVGAQFYTGDRISADAPTVGKGGKTYAQCGGFALEPQACPDAINKPNFPSNVLRPDELYHHISRYSIARN